MDGDVKYLSHRETLRMLARACVRAALPVRRTEGFNPRLRLSLPLPRPVGISSQAERLIIELNEPMTPEEVGRRLGEQLPAGMSILGVCELTKGEGCFPERVRYGVDVTDFDVGVLRERSESLLSRDEIYHERFIHKTNQHKRVDLRPYLDTVDVGPTGLEFRLWVTPTGTARPAEICQLLGLESSRIQQHIRRLEVTWH